MNRGKALAIFLSVFIGFQAGLWAQSGTQVRITGNVTDATTNETLVGVTIVVEGTQQGTITDLNGNFSIVVPGAGSALVFSYVGYTNERTVVGDQRFIQIAMTEEMSRLGEVVVTAQARGQRRAMNEQINSNTIKNVVSPDRLQENPDANAIESIGRLPGISVLRGGGEGTALVVRGLEPRYTNVTMGGIQMPSTGGGSRETNISGISQYILQGVEVYKSLTPDMEANAVGGTINMTLKAVPNELHYGIMAQGGYNNLNRYYGNNKLQGEISNRFLNNRLGVFLSVNSERVNRSTQTMSADYDSGDATELNILIRNINLNNIEHIRQRNSAMLSMDYRLHPSTVWSLYSLYTRSDDDHIRQSKNYGVTGHGRVGYTFHHNPYRNNDILQSTWSGVTNFDFLNLELDYGASYAVSNTRDPESRSWNFEFIGASNASITTATMRKKYPHELIPLYLDRPDSLQNLQLFSFDRFNSKWRDENMTGFVNLKIPYKIGDLALAYIKLGGTYREKTRYRDDTGGGQLIRNNDSGKIWGEQQFGWMTRNSRGELNAAEMTAYRINRFLHGQYDFGWYFDMDKMNAITDWWTEMTDNYFRENPEALNHNIQNRGYRYDIYSSVMNDQDMKENYVASYVMTEINVGKWLMMMPGVRYEQTTARMSGHDVSPPVLAPMWHETEKLPVHPVSSTRSDKYWLPMMHIRMSPSEWFYSHLAYTNTLSRPDFNMISPNQYINSGFSPFSINVATPRLNAELWTNYDAQFTLHGNRIGLISVTGFHKTVENKIWHRSFRRLPNDPIIDPFPNNSLVNVSTWENHKYPIYLQGVELEIQTSFWYLPTPFRYFTINANYTYTHSETQYPTTRIENIVPPQGGRPVPVRIDSVQAGPMLFQPKHITNLSVGFNRKGLNIWTSFQYNGMIYTGKNYQVDELDPLKEKFYRWDLQVSQKLGNRFQGFEILANLANLSDFSETSRLRGDPRPTYMENYGWTADVGIRYRF